MEARTERARDRQHEYESGDRYNAAKIPLRYRQTQTRAICPEWVEAYEAARAEVLNPGATVFLVGDRGIGKTHLACELIRVGCWRGLTGRYDTWSDITGRWRESMVGDSGKSEREIVAEYGRYGLLVIDEWEVAKDGEFGDRAFRELIDCRYRNMRSTVVLSNLSAEALVTRLDKSIVSRMQECGRVIPCEWKSLRASAMEARQAK